MDETNNPAPAFWDGNKISEGLGNILLLMLAGTMLLPTVSVQVNVYPNRIGILPLSHFEGKIHISSKLPNYKIAIDQSAEFSYNLLNGINVDPLFFPVFFDDGYKARPSSIKSM